MRRPRPQATAVLAALAALALAAAPASAQSTARPLPALGLDSPISAVAASFPVAAPLAATATPAAATVAEASGPNDGAWVPAATTPEAESFSSLELFALVQGEASLQDLGGTVALQRGGLDATIGRRSADRAFALHLRSESTFYEWGSSTALVPGSAKPFNDLYETSASLQLAVRADATWTWLAGLEVTLGGEDLVDPTDALTLGGLVGVRHQVADEVDFTFGLAGESRLEDDAWVMPFFGFDWRLAEDTRLALQGSEVRLEQGLTDDLGLSFLAGYDVRQYRLNEDGPTAGGVFRDEQVQVALGLDWQVSEAGRLGLTVGRNLWSEYSALDGAGAELGLSEADPSTYVGLSLTFGM